MNGVVLTHNKIVHWSFKKSVDKVNMFFWFFAKTAKMRQEGFFLLFLAIFSQKSPPWRISAAVKLEKSKISKKRELGVVAGTLRYIYTHF